jgi:hypothetical protein
VKALSSKPQYCKQTNHRSGLHVPNNWMALQAGRQRATQRAQRSLRAAFLTSMGRV